MKFTGQGPQVTSGKLAAFEQKIGVSLPFEYRAFLLKNNGGVPENTAISWRDELDREAGTTLAEFLSLGGQRGIEEAYDMTSSVIPPGYLPIAEDIAGNLFCFCLDDNDLGAIFFWDHEVSSSDPQSLTWVCGSIDELLTRLTSASPSFSADEQRLQEILTEDDVVALQQMLSMGLDIDFKDDAGLSLLEKSAMFSRPHIFQFLLGVGAEMGRASDFATRLNRAEILDILQEMGMQ